MFHRTRLLLHARFLRARVKKSGGPWPIMLRRGGDGGGRMGIGGGGKGVGRGMIKGDAHRFIIAVPPLPASGPSPRARCASSGGETPKLVGFLLRHLQSLVETFHFRKQFFFLFFVEGTPLPEAKLTFVILL